MADWSELPSELLQLISKKLNNSEIYLIRFRSVCSSWRSSIPNYPHSHFPLKLRPFSDSEKIFRKLSKHSIFLIKPPRMPNHQTLLRPWLIRIDLNLSRKNRLWHPLLRDELLPFHNEVLDFHQLSVINLGHMFYIQDRVLFHPRSDVYSEKVIVATCQEQQPADIVTVDYSGETTMFSCGHDYWTKIPNVAKSHEDICIFKGRPCVVDKTGRTMMIGSDFNVHLVADPFIGGDVKFLVESECQLFLVDSYDSDGDDDVRIDVFRLDEKDKKWVKLANLGDRVLFLGEGCSFSASASDLGFDNGNLVIYVNGKVSGCKMCVFQLDQGRVSLLSDYPDYLKLFWPPPEWINRLHL